MAEPMNSSEQANRHPQNEHLDAPDEPRPVLVPLLRALKPYGRTILILICLSALVALLYGIALWAVVYPTQKTATLRFQLTFDGADDLKYPNGTRFSVEDMLSAPVLRRVYDANDLKKYSTFEAFRSSLFVTSVNLQRERLELEYKARLSDSKLMAMERNRLEREFSDKAAALKSSSYSIILVRNERLKEMNRVLVDKVLRGVLNEWAEDAAKVRGALRYNLPVFSKALIQKDILKSEDYLVGVDMLRTKISRVIGSIDQLMKIPGIQVIRLPESGVSLPEIRIRLEDLVSSRVAPLVGLIRAKGVTKDADLTILYIQNRLFEVRLDDTAALEREKKVKSGFEVYLGSERKAAGAAAAKGAQGDSSAGSNRDLGAAAVIPQFGETFLDRIMQLGNRSSDVVFRQDLTERIIAAGFLQVDYGKETAYYKDLEEAFKGSAKRTSDDAARTATVQEVERRFAQAIEEAERNVDAIQALYELISARNLRPQSLLYSVQGGASFTTTNSFSPRRYVGISVLAVFFVGIVAAAAALAFDRIRKIEI